MPFCYRVQSGQEAWVCLLPGQTIIQASVLIFHLFFVNPAITHEDERGGPFLVLR